VGGKKVFKCGLCTPIYEAHRDEKAAHAYMAKNLAV
jgi:hypothetical protein